MKCGIFSVYKPSGMSSATVVNNIRTILLNNSLPKEHVDSTVKIKVGHGGTLDRAAEGVLVIGVGNECKKLHHYLHGNKEYIAVGELGVSTDTLDADGKVTDKKPYNHVFESDLKLTLKSFEGKQSQIPPLFSALKISGERISDLARRGININMNSKQRTITVYSIHLRRLNLPQFEILVSCSSGTYIRSLVRDIALNLGTVAHLKHLCRTRQGNFHLEDALPIHRWTYEDFCRTCNSYYEIN